MQVPPSQIDDGMRGIAFASRSDPVAGQKCFLPFQDAGTGEDWPSKPGFIWLSLVKPNQRGSDGIPLCVGFLQG